MRAALYDVTVRAGPYLHALMVPIIGHSAPLTTALDRTWPTDLGGSRTWVREWWAVFCHSHLTSDLSLLSTDCDNRGKFALP